MQNNTAYRIIPNSQKEKGRGFLEMYAIFDIKGKQHKVEQGDIVSIDRVEKEAGEIIEFEDVLFVSDDKDVKVGTPTIANAKIVGEIVGEIKDKKIISFKYKKRKSYSRKIGHRQKYTAIRIKEIVTKC